jgi:uridine kinase
MDSTLKNALPLSKIYTYLKSGKVFAIAIDGKCGAGKSTLAEDIKKYLKANSFEISIIHLDSFIRPKKFRSYYSSPKDYDFERVLNEVLIPLKNGKRALFDLYDWSSDSFKKQDIINPPTVLIIEGVNSCDKSLKDYMDFMIFVNLDKETRKQRVLKRGDFTQKEFEVWSEAEDEIYKQRDIENYYDFVYNT